MAAAGASASSCSSLSVHLQVSEGHPIRQRRPFFGPGGFRMAGNPVELAGLACIFLESTFRFNVARPWNIYSNIHLLGRASGILSKLVDARSPSSDERWKSSQLESRKNPECQPWSREDFLNRLGTFKSVDWFDKPEQLSAFESARYGW